MDGAFVYILLCSDGSYYTGTAGDGLERRIAEHNGGAYGGYTATRGPVRLVFSQWFERVTDAIAAERQLKGWSRAKKEALIRGDFAGLPDLARRRHRGPTSFETPACGGPSGWGSRLTLLQAQLSSVPK